MEKWHVPYVDHQDNSERNSVSIYLWETYSRCNQLL